MRFAHVVLPDSDQPMLAVVRADTAIIVEELFPGAPRLLEQLIAGGDAVLDRVRDAAETAEPGHPLASVSFASACLTPPVVLAVGLNYAAHSSELG
ncbi:MAG: 2-hydroxyhepta-2,4-diene-1,7-dioate isomerase, partial [Actinobacteria bacterium]|nr:2-hydroxyhepta-2,4-diene-1,7-dioate isomerase [Actinomycetota bacterium]